MVNTIPVRRSFQVMLKPVGATCNLACAYCFYLEKAALYEGSHFRMSETLLDTFTQHYVAAQPRREVFFAWQGGEPTLRGLSFFETAVEIQERYARPGQTVRNAIQTNGVLLDSEWCRFFGQNNFLVGLSLDGPEELHDTYRRDRAARGTFGRVMRAVDLLKRHGVDFNILTCVHAENVGRPLAVYRFLRDDVGARFVQFIPVVERTPNGAGVSPRSVEAAAYGQFLITIFDAWIRHDVGQVFVRTFDAALAAWLGYRPGICIFEETCGRALILEHTGDLYSCDHFVDSTHSLGNVQEAPLHVLANHSRQQRFGADKRDALPRCCRDCPVRFVCNGGCPKDRIVPTPEGQHGLNYLCSGYRAFFQHVDGPMRMMASEWRAGRPPSNVMRLLAT